MKLFKECSDGRIVTLDAETQKFTSNEEFKITRFDGETRFLPHWFALMEFDESPEKEDVYTFGLYLGMYVGLCVFLTCLWFVFFGS